MSTLLLLHPDPRTRAMLAGALEPTYQLETVLSWKELERVLRSRAPLGCILDIFNLSRVSTLPALRKLRKEHPGPALIACADFSGREMELYRLGRINVDGVIRLEDDLSSREILEVVDRATMAALAGMVLRSVAPDHSPVVQECIRWAIAEGVCDDMGWVLCRLYAKFDWRCECK